ncbi:serine hydrolase [Streptomyces sp. NPDC032472]|uniref:serine hydrolase n=1 Tax=Streptomyces sp. NPDC032472 TaxID=3155018 RepID=UPI0033E92CEF
MTEQAGQQDAIAAILASQPEQPPGRRFSYSNSNYVLLSHVVTITAPAASVARNCSPG